MPLAHRGGVARPLLLSGTTMRNPLYRYLRPFGLALVLAGAAGGCTKDSPAPAPSAPAAAPSAPAQVGPAHTMSPSTVDPAPTAGLSRIEDPSQVCMVTNQFMGKPQIPVEVEGKTYFGCCPMCKGRLETEPETRSATDPVTGEAIDKATAVLAQDEGGAILYFASEQTFQAYMRR